MNSYSKISKLKFRSSRTRLFAISLLVGLSMLIAGFQPTAASPVVTTDKADYAPGETVTISGSGFSTSSSYDIPVIRPDGTIVKGGGSTFVPGFDTVTTDDHGDFVYEYILNGIEGLYEVRVYDASWNPTGTTDINDSVFAEAPVASVTFTDAGGNIDQCANGSVTRFLADSTDVDQCQGTAWVNGNLGASKSHYLEGQSVPYRDELSGLDAGVQYTFEIEWDVTKSTKHALDYLTSFDRTETDADPCSDKGFGTGCETSPDGTIGIPGDTHMTSQTDWGGAVPTPDPAQESFALWGGTFSIVSPYEPRTLDGSGEYVSDAATAVQVTFTVDGSTAICADDNGTSGDTTDDKDCSVVLAWGGHIASRADWGDDNAAVNITGSPYHMRQKALYVTSTWIDADSDGFIDTGEAGNVPGVGNQDRSLSNQAVIFPGSITIIKDADPNDPKDFEYNVTDDVGAPVTDANGDLVNNFLLDDDADGTLSNTDTFTLLPGVYDYTELAVAGWDLTTIICEVDDTVVTTIPDGTDEGSVLITLDEAEDVTCTFNNTKRGKILISKVTVPSGDLTEFDFTLTGGPSSLDQSFPLADGDNPHDSGFILPGTGYNATESVPGGWSLTSATCNDDSPVNNIDVSSGETVICTFTNTLLISSLDIEKATNTLDADTPTGPIVPVGDPVTWSYVVTNTGTGNNTVSGIAVNDSDLGTITCPQTTLGAGASMTCTAETGVAAAGQYDNLATATGTDEAGGPVTDTDPSHYRRGRWASHGHRSEPLLWRSDQSSVRTRGGKDLLRTAADFLQWG